MDHPGEALSGNASGVDSGADRRGDAGVWRSTWDTPAARGASASEMDGAPSGRHPAHGRQPLKRAGHLRALGDGGGSQAEVASAAEERGESAADSDAEASSEESKTIAAESLVRKLRVRSLSISEARTVLKTHGIDTHQIDDVLDDFTRRGYLDDVALAEQLIESGSQRKGQGRIALSRALAQRGIPRDVISAALDELPDDDAERALEFARTKARSLSRLDGDTALRRLVGQLSRRGYNGLVAMTAAKTALAEATFGGSPSGVRFVDSD